MANKKENEPSKVCKLYLLLKDYPTFDLENAVCNHGFFMMAPNVWDPSTKSLMRPLRLADSVNSVNVTISKPLECNFLLIQVHDMDSVFYLDKEAILAQVSRMIRLSSKDENDVQQFHKIHPEGKNSGFGRIFRATSLFEDAVKCILLCFCKWGDSLRMARSLCDLQLELSNGSIPGGGGMSSHTQGREGAKRKRDFSLPYKVTQTAVGNFPSAQELASLDLDILKYHFKLGFRAIQIHKFAKDVHSGKCKLSSFEAYASQQDLHKKLMKINGFGSFVSANMEMCLGFYANVPIDTETIRHLKEVHRKRGCTKRKVKGIAKKTYGRYAPFQCLAFWFELARYYESKLGKLSELPSSRYTLVTGSQCGTKSSEDNEQ